jgi:uncharacterized protein
MNTVVTPPSNPAEIAENIGEVIVPVSRWIWPGILIAGPASVVIACIITAFFVLQHPEALVATDYYKQGKAINAQLSQLRRAESLGLSTMTMTVTDTVFSLRFPDARENDTMAALVRIEIVLAHPADASRDIRAIATATVSGVYEVPLKQKLIERRRVIVTDSPTHSWRVESLYTPPKP